MKYRNEKPNLYALLDSARLSTTQRREAIAHIQQAEAGMDIIFPIIDFFRRMVAGVARGWNAESRTSGQNIFCDKAHAAPGSRSPR